MSTTSTKRRNPTPWLLQVPEVRDYGAPQWFERLPRFIGIGGVLLVLMAISAVLRTRYINGQFWSDEAIAVGIASHPLAQIPGILRHDGSAPLYYAVLHVWIDLFGSGETATHILSLLIGMISIPLAMWAGWSIGGRRAGMLAALLFAFSAFFTEYAQETQAYELLALIGLLAAVSFVHAFIGGRRGYLIAFTLTLALMLYTSFWAIFFWAGAALALVVVHRSAAEPARVLRDAAIAFGGALVLFIPWIPNLLYQMANTTSPWGYADFPGATFPGDVLGADRVVVALAVAAAIGILPLLRRDLRRTPEATMIWSLLIIPFAAVLLARLTSLISPTWVTRYFAPVVAPLLLAAALSSARAGIMGLIAVILSIAFVANVASYTPKNKSDMRDVAGELAPLMRPGDLVLVGMPEQSPLAWYYLPAGLRYATTMGPVSDPSYMNWVNAYSRLKDTNPRTALNSLVATMTSGQRLLYTRPLTEGVKSWRASWPQLVRRRAAQWGALIAADPQLHEIAGAVAPHNYRGACCVADNAVVYAKGG